VSLGAILLSLHQSFINRSGASVPHTTAWQSPIRNLEHPYPDILINPQRWNDKDIRVTMFQIADRRLVIAEPGKMGHKKHLLRP